MAQPWWKKTKEIKHVRVNKDSFVALTNGKHVPIKKNALISPVRKAYLARTHELAKYYDETREMVADTTVGFGKISLEDVDW